MKMIHRLVACIAAIGSAALFSGAASAQWNPTTSCGQLGGYELEDCLGKALAAADAALNTAYKRARDMIAANAKTSADQKTAWLANLEKAEKAWLAYRDANCLFDLVGAEWNFGSGTTSAQQQCVLALTQARTDELLQRYPNN